MAQTINTNVASLTAQRNLNNSGMSLNTSLERLSSGLRINSAKDDAAGLAISERFTAQIRGLNQAARNSNDGISLAQTAEGAMAEITTNLQRIRELAVQSANATNSSSDRAALQTEVSELLEEIDRVAAETSFNGVSLLDGTFASQAFQVGANAGQTISIDSITSARTAVLGEVIEATTTGSTAATTVSGLTINGTTVADSADSAELAANINSAVSGVTATVEDSATSAVLTVTATANGSGGAQDRSFTLNGTLVDTGLTAVADSTADTAVAALYETAINTAGITGVTVEVTGAGVEITDASGGDIVISSAATDSDFSDATTAATTTGGEVTLSSSEDIVIGGTVANSGFSAATITAAGTDAFLDTLTVATVDGSNNALGSIDAALTTINSARAELGAVQNRFESVVRSLETTSTNLSASRSRILDTDFAAETANLTRAQILQQAGTAMLAQANALPQNVLSLLQ